MKINGLRVLVTGGAGFIGSHIVERLVEDGARVTVYDDLSSGSMDNLSNVHKDVLVVRGDILDFPKLKRTIKGMDIVSHQAAHLEITKCIEDPIDDMRVNTIGTLNVLKAAVAGGVRKVISASSACVYGQARYIPQDEEGHPTDPNWAYGAAKLAGEKYCRIFTELHGIQTVCLRYAIIYGPREWYGRVLTIFLKRALKNRAPVVFDRGNQLRDFTFVEDVADLHHRCVTHNTGSHQVLNASTGIGTSIRKLARTVARVTGLKGEPVHEYIKEGQRSKKVDEDRMRLPCELKRMVLDSSKAQRILRWQPRVGLTTGLRREYEWLRKDPGVWTKMSY